MYSTTALIKNSKHSGKLVGSHQRIDRIARKLLTPHLKKGQYFPSTKEILAFEGTHGPDGLKRKSPGVDEPMHFIIPEKDDGQLIKMILDHQYNLRRALKADNRVRTAFEAAWMAHAIADGLTPAHHFPYNDAVDELMTEKEFFKVFGTPIKGIMHGRSLAETARNNWLYWGANGYMSKHIAFEYGIAITMASLPDRIFLPKLYSRDFKEIDLKWEFYHTLARIHKLDMYTKFRHKGWNTELALETKEILLPEIIRLITLAWASCLPDDKPAKIAKGEQ
ncbi:hypothetical protein IKF76_00325 [Candidatus Saccharibacteria bacterium]|nr:hypothetical protein [Candidatus Saccharibacteria bacterium]